MVYTMGQIVWITTTGIASMDRDDENEITSSSYLTPLLGVAYHQSQTQHVDDGVADVPDLVLCLSVSSQ